MNKKALKFVVLFWLAISGVTGYILLAMCLTLRYGYLPFIALFVLPAIAGLSNLLYNRSIDDQVEKARRGY